MPTADSSDPQRDLESDPEYLPAVTSSIIYVADVERSIAFYRDLFGCRPTVRDRASVILVTPTGFQLYLIDIGRREQPGSRGTGMQFLGWAVSSLTELQECEKRLHNHGAHRDSRESAGIRFVEGVDPDGIRLVVAFPSPMQQPRTRIDASFYA